MVVSTVGGEGSHVFDGRREACNDVSMNGGLFRTGGVLEAKRLTGNKRRVAVYLLKGRGDGLLMVYLASTQRAGDRESFWRPVRVAQGLGTGKTRQR